jgi:hypothetical protein
MIRIIFAAMTALFLMAPLTGPARAQSDDIQGVIASQLEAFKVDDFATAFTYASPTIKRLFGTAERFGAMVKQGYPMVWRPADVTYLAQEMRDGMTYQNVLIQDGSGGLFTFEYEMIQTENGWQINGVRPLQDPPVAA